MSSARGGLAAGVSRLRRLLLAEDEPLVGYQLAAELRGAGLEVVGPLERLADVVGAADDSGLDGAILDVDLHGDEVFAAADLLTLRHVPVVFHTAYMDDGQLQERYPQATVCTKPANTGELLQALEAAAARLRDEAGDR